MPRRQGRPGRAELEGVGAGRGRAWAVLRAAGATPSGGAGSAGARQASVFDLPVAPGRHALLVELLRGPSAPERAGPAGHGGLRAELLRVAAALVVRAQEGLVGGLFRAVLPVLTAPRAAEESPR